MPWIQVVLLPVLAGAFLNQYFQGLVKFVSPMMPPIAVATVAVLCGNAIAQSASAILTSGRQVVLAASLLHASGFFFGYILSRMLGIDVSSSRTISIEVGMQVSNSYTEEAPFCSSSDCWQHSNVRNPIIFHLFPNYILFISWFFVSNWILLKSERM